MNDREDHIVLNGNRILKETYMEVETVTSF